MTVVGALPDGNGGYWIGSDSLATASEARCSLKEQKILLRKDGWALGVSGAGRAIDLLRKHWASTDLTDPLAISDALRSILKEDDWNFGSSEGRPGWVDLNLLVCGPGQLWLVLSDLCLIPHDPDLCPGLFVGSGSDFAVGAAIYGTAEGHEPESVLRRSLEAACRIDLHCGGEITIHHIPGGQP